MLTVATSEQPWRPIAQTRGGDVESKYVAEGELLPGVGYSSIMIKFNEGDRAFTAPRHRHDFEQLRLTLSGTHDFGLGQVCKQGWVSYFPAGAFYGPEIMDSGALMQVQWSDHWVTRAQNDTAIKELNEQGQFVDGSYRYIDDENGKEGQKDGSAAVWEHIYKRPSKIPSPKYPRPILIDPDAFEWQKHTDDVSIKMLGRFTERDIVIAKIKWDRAAPYVLDSGRTWCLFTMTGEVSVGDGTFGPHTAIWSDAGDTDSVEGEPGAEAMCFGFAPVTSFRVPASEDGAASGQPDLSFVRGSSRSLAAPASQSPSAGSAEE